MSFVKKRVAVEGVITFQLSEDTTVKCERGKW